MSSSECLKRLFPLTDQPRKKDEAPNPYLTEGDKLAQYYESIAEETTGVRRDLLEAVRATGTRGIDPVAITSESKLNYPRKALNSLLQSGILRAVNNTRGSVKIVFHEFDTEQKIVLPYSHIN